MKNILVLLLMSFFLLGGCSNEEDKTTPDQSGSEQIFVDQTRALEKAKGIDQLIQSGVDKRRQAIEEQSN